MKKITYTPKDIICRHWYLRQYSIYTMYAHLIHCCTCQFQSYFKLVDFDIHGYTCILTLQRY